MLLILWLPVLFLGRSAVLGGQRYWWLHDDAMISMRYARNLAHGAGLVWNPGERVEGYTNFLWTLWMAAIHLSPLPPAATSLAVLASNIGLSLVALPLLIRLVRGLGGGTAAVVAALICYVANADIMAWALGGFETVLLTVLILLALVRLLEERQTGRPRASTYLAMGTLTLVRADAPLIAALLCAVAVLITPRRRTLPPYIALVLVFPVVQEVFRLWYYGDLLPNTYYLKATRWPGRTASGIRYVWHFAQTYAPAILVALSVAAYNRSRVSLALIGLLAAYASYVAYIGGDVYENYRFFVPLIPVLFAVAFAGIAALPLRPLEQAVALALCLAFAPINFYGYWSANLNPPYQDTGNIAIGLLLRQQTAPDAKVADFWAGTTFYFSQRPGIDLLGLTDPRIAHMAVVSNGTKPGHNKFDFAWSLGVRHPDYVIANWALPVTVQAMRAQSSGDWAFDGRLYFDPSFRRHCLAHTLMAGTWRTIFACQWPASARTASIGAAR